MVLEKPREKGKYWYRFHHTDCVMGDYGSTWKERVYDEPKPDEWWKRHIEEQTLCGSHYDMRE